MSRPDWDKYFLSLAEQVSTRATCKRAKHGCVLVIDNTILSTGYNGSPPGTPHCIDSECILINNHCKVCNHAEMNAVCQAAIKGIKTEGSTAYITGDPCCDCLRILLCSKIAKIVYKIGGHYPYPKEEETLRQYFLKYSKIEYIGI